MRELKLIAMLSRLVAEWQSAAQCSKRLWALSDSSSAGHALIESYLSAFLFFLGGSSSLQPGSWPEEGWGYLCVCAPAQWTWLAAVINTCCCYSCKGTAVLSLVYACCLPTHLLIHLPLALIPPLPSIQSHTPHHHQYRSNSLSPPPPHPLSGVASARDAPPPPGEAHEEVDEAAGG